jgi:HlyD family secretion protein
VVIFFSSDMPTFLTKIQEMIRNAPTRRRLFVITVGVLVLLLLAYGFLPKPVPVDVVKASRGPKRVTVEEEGKTRVKDRFVISAPVPGYMRRIALDVGDPVKKGQKVAELEPLWSTVLDTRSRAEAEAAVSAAQASLNAAEEKERAAAADAEYAKQRLERSKKLYDGGYIAKDSLDQAESDARRAEAIQLSAGAAVNAARADLERALAVLIHSAAGEAENAAERVSVCSPVSGRVLKRHRESAGVVNSGDALLDVGNPRNLEVYAEILSADAVKIKQGTPVLFERWGGDTTLEGRVRVVEPAGFTKVSSLGVEEQRVNVIVDFTSPADIWQGLGDGYRLDASFIIWEGKDVLQVPASALFRAGDGWAVFTVVNRRARLRAIEVGHRNGLTAEILSGLTEGEMVITHPDDSIRDGTRVRLR